MLAHDIRNPVRIIDGYAELVAESLDRIRQAAARITEIAEATLAFVRAGELSSVESLAVQGLATGAWQQALRGDGSLTVDESTAVHGDRRLLLQPFENLFRNAVERAGPACAVRVGPVDGGFYVVDDTPGIPAAIRARTLREDLSTQGTGGRGLPIVRAIIEAHGGEPEILDAASGDAQFEITGADIAPEEASPFQSTASPRETPTSES